MAKVAELFSQYVTQKCKVTLTRNTGKWRVMDDVFLVGVSNVRVADRGDLKLLISHVQHMGDDHGSLGVTFRCNIVSEVCKFQNHNELSVSAFLNASWFRYFGPLSSGWPPADPVVAASGVCSKLLVATQGVSDLRNNSGELVLICSLCIHVLRLRSTLICLSLISDCCQSHADQRGTGMTFLSSLLSASQRIRTFKHSV